MPGPGKRPQNSNRRMAPANQEMFALGLSQSNKKQKLSVSSAASSSSQSAHHSSKLLHHRTSSTSSSSLQSDSYQQGVHCPPGDLVERIERNIDENPEQVEKLICGAVSAMKKTKSRPDKILIISILLISRKYPEVFGRPECMNAVISLLKHAPMEYTKQMKLNSGNANGASSVNGVVACKILYQLLEDDYDWPANLITVFLEDSLGDRAWVDSGECRGFVDNLLTAYNTKLSEDMMTVSSSSNVNKNNNDTHPRYHVAARFQNNAAEVRKLTIECLREAMTSPKSRDALSSSSSVGGASGGGSGMGGQAALMRTLMMCCGLAEVRTMAMSRMEQWLNKNTKAAHDLLMAICMNCNSHSQEDVDVMMSMTRMRLSKNRVVGQFVQCLRELERGHSSNLQTVVTHLLFLEISNSRVATNMTVIQNIVAEYPDRVSTYLAFACREVLLRDDGSLIVLRQFIRELMRATRNDINVVAFVKGLLSMRHEDREAYRQLEPKRKGCLIGGLCDLSCMVTLQCVTQPVREALTAQRRSHQTSIDQEMTIDKFRRTLTSLQLVSLVWCRDFVLKHAPADYLESEHFYHLITKVLFVKNADAYCNSKDNWPPDGERHLLMKSCQDNFYVNEKLLVTICEICRSPDIPRQVEGLELIRDLVRRSAAIPPLSSGSDNPCSVERDEDDVISALVQLAQIQPGRPPMLVQQFELGTSEAAESLCRELVTSKSYWTLMELLLVLAAFNPATLAQRVWHTVPTVKCLIEMVLSNRYQFPPITVVDQQERNKMIGIDQQITMNERHAIMELERMSTRQQQQQQITEQNSFLVRVLMSADHVSAARRPPDHFLAALTQLALRLHLAARLCRSRAPVDYLHELLSRYDDADDDVVAVNGGEGGGAADCVDWLCELVSLTKGDVSALNLRSVCELVVSFHRNRQEDGVEDPAHKKLTQTVKLDELLDYLRSVLAGDDQLAAVEVTSYFLRRLSSSTTSVRRKSRDAIASLLAELDDDGDFTPLRHDYRWLVRDLASTKCYRGDGSMKWKIMSWVKEGAMVECDADCAVAYLVFLSRLMRDDDDEDDHSMTAEIALLAANFIYHRSVLVKAILSMKKEKLIIDDDEEEEDMSVAQCFVTTLLSIMNRYMKINLSQAPLPPPTHSDAIDIRWPNGDCGRFSNVIPRAILLLLSYGPPSLHSSSSSSSYSDEEYNELLHMWLDQSGRFLPETYRDGEEGGEELVCMIEKARILMHSPPASPLLVQACCTNKNEVIAFVQTFGIPVATVNYMFQMLDGLSEGEVMKIVEAAQNQTAQNQLVNLNIDFFLDYARLQQNREGVTAGASFIALLKRCWNYHEQMETSASENSTSPKPCDVEATKDDVMCEDDVIIVDDDDDLTSDDSIRKQIVDVLSQKGGDLKKWRLLISSVNEKTQYSQNVVVILSQLVQNDPNVVKLMTSSSRACSLLRALDRVNSSTNHKLSPSSGGKSQFKQMMTSLHDKLNSAAADGDCVNKTLRSFVSVWMQRNTSSLDDHKQQQQQTVAPSNKRMEEQLVTYLNKEKDVKKKINHVTDLLRDEIVSVQGKTPRMGLLIDWLQLLDPEILAQTPDIQRRLLFDRSTNKHNMGGYDQTYLLSLLRDNCNWPAILNTIYWLLSPSAQESSIKVDPRTALDFLWVVIQAPTLWQGRENKSTSVSEPVMILNCQQTCQLLSYIVSATATQRRTTGNEEPNYYIDHLITIFSKFGQDKCGVDQLTEVIKFVRSNISTATLSTSQQDGDDDDGEVGVWWEVFALLYIMKPAVPVWDQIQKFSFDPNSVEGLFHEDLLKFSETIARVSTGSCDCRTDALICQLINRLGYVHSSNQHHGHGKIGSAMKMATQESALDASLYLIKISHWRPFLLLRQMTMFVALVSGRTRFEFSEFKSQHHLPLTLNLIYILQQLARHLLQPHYEPQVAQLMGILWQAMKNYIAKARKQMKSVMLRTLAITHKYIFSLPKSAYKLLSKHILTIKILRENYPDYEPVTRYLRSIEGWLRMNSDYVDVDDGEEEECGGGGDDSWRPDDVTTTTATTSSVRRPYLVKPPLLIEVEDLRPVWDELILNDNQYDVALVYQILDKIDEQSKRRDIDDWSPYVLRLSTIFANCNDGGVRGKALGMLLRHCRAQPECAMPFVFESYLKLVTFSARKDSSHDWIHGSDPDLDETRLYESNMMDRVYESIMSDGEATGSPPAAASPSTTTSEHAIMDRLPEVSILCRERAHELIGAVFDVACRQSLVTSPPNHDQLPDLISKSLWALRGLAHSDLCSS